MRFFGKQKLLPYFETSLIQQIEFDKQRELKLQTTQDKPNVPKILQAFIEYFNNPSILETEGLFRTTGSLKSVRLLKEEIEKTGVIAFNAPEIEIITVASLMKLWLRELTDGVIPKELFDTFDAATEDTAIALQRLGNISYETLKYIVKFLITLISYSEKNKMVIKNVCIVFGPTLFKCPSDCPDDGSPSSNYMNESLKTSMMLKFIIENQEKLFINDEYRLVKEKERVVDIDESNNIKKSNSVESLSSDLKRSKSQIKDKETKDKEVKDKVELKDAPMLLSPLSNAISAVLYDDTPPDVVQPKIKEKGSRDDLLKSTELLAQIKEKTSLENVRVQGEHSITAEPIIPIAATNNIIVLPSDVDNSASPELPVSTPKFKRVGKSIPKLNTSGGTLLAPIDKKFDALTPISPANMLLSDASTPTTSVVLNFNTELKPPKRPPPATPATAGQTSPKYLPGTRVRSSSLTKTIQSMSDISTTSEAAPSPSKGISKLQYGRSTYGSAEQLTTPIKYSPATPGSAFITDFSTAITPTEHRNKLSNHLPEMPARPAPPPPMDQIQSPTVPASPKREQHLSFLPASPVTKKKSPLSPSVTNFSEPRVLSFLPNSNSSDNMEQKKHSSKSEEGSPPLIQTIVRNRSKKLKKVEIEKKENIEDAKSPKSLSPSKSFGTFSDPQTNEANEQTDQFTPLQSKINSSTLILADKSPINLSQDLFKKSKSQLSRDDIKEVKETFRTLQNMVKESKCSESDLAQYKSLKKVIKKQDELCKLKEEKNRVKRELAELKDTVAQKKDGIMIPKEHKQLLKSLYERYCELKGQIEKLEPGDERYSQLKQRKRELQEKIHQYQEEFQNINGHPIQTVQDIEPLKQEYSEYKVNGF
ncbi:Protein fam13c [Boothiomyces macroporosus]|uniref:Protein fam13c n=1 Tax=Boothiomyces macroporosus TaxID=261099 RepID=A0AAD5UFG9_9FUNG|nr:Protein fam13c [Boothiomyces macroporosus]